jgi:hypothetical protein
MDTVLNLRELETITAEELASCSFPSEDVYLRDEDKRVRFVSLDKAMTLAKHDRYKTLLVIRTTEGFKSLKTYVLAMNFVSVTIEGNYQIPIQAVYSVNIE